LNSLEKKIINTRENQAYISKYRMIFKRVIKEAKKRESDRYVANATNKTKAMWQVINKEAGKNPQNKQEMELKYGVKKLQIHGI
jgi:hypothetical protein